jgi:hypothetical protein
MSTTSHLCANCKTERFGIYCRGYCHRCYRLALEKEQVERWDLDNPSTLKRVPSIAYQVPSEFPKIKAQKIRELELRLQILQWNENDRSGPVEGIDIERLLRRLAKHSGGKEEVIGNIASPITAQFGPKARRFLLELLLDIEESRRWNPREYWHALHPEEAQRIIDHNWEIDLPIQEKTRKRKRKQEGVKGTREIRVILYAKDDPFCAPAPVLAPPGSIQFL